MEESASRESMCTTMSTAFVPSAMRVDAPVPGAASVFRRPLSRSSSSAGMIPAPAPLSFNPGAVQIMLLVLLVLPSGLLVASALGAEVLQLPTDSVDTPALGSAPLTLKPPLSRSRNSAGRLPMPASLLLDPGAARSMLLVLLALWGLLEEPLRAAVLQLSVDVALVRAPLGATCSSTPRARLETSCVTKNMTFWETPRQPRAFTTFNEGMNVTMSAKEFSENSWHHDMSKRCSWGQCF